MARRKQEIVEEEPEEVKPVVPIEPPYGTVEWIHWWAESEGHLPTPINISITGSIKYHCPDLMWYNFDVYPHKVKMTNTGYTVHIGAKWKTERPYLIGGPFLEKHIIGQIHFHWGCDLASGSAHTVDNVHYPAEMQVSFFKSEYITQQEALKHSDGVTMICYMIKYGVLPSSNLEWVIEGFPRIHESMQVTKIGPKPMSKLLPMFFEDYFVYWGNLATAHNENYAIRWLVPRASLFASMEQIEEFYSLLNPWDEPHPGNIRPLQEKNNRHVFLIRPHWNLYNSLLPTPRIPEPSISILSSEYRRKIWMLPKQNVSLIEMVQNENEEREAGALT